MKGTYALRSVPVSIYIRMHVFRLLCISRVYGKPEWTPLKHVKCVMQACAKQNA